MSWHERRYLRSAIPSPLWPLGIALLLGPLLLGGGYAWATLGTGMAVGFACLAIWLDAPEAVRRARLPWSILLLTVPLVWTGVQALPLPCGVVEWLAPQLAREMRSSIGLLPGADQQCALSYDPGGSRLELLKGLSLWTALLCGWLLSREGERRRVLGLVCLSTLVVALVALGHQVAAAERVFGVYEPKDVQGPVWGPLLNPNHLSGFATMGVAVAAVLGVTSPPSEWKWMWFGAALILTMTTVATASRTGIATLLITQVTVLALLLRRGGRSSSGRQLGALVGVVAAALGLAAVLFASELTAEVRSESFTKLELVADGWRFTLLHPWLGVGRGGFSAGFVAFGGSWNRYVYPESLPVQWIAEWGYPVGVLAIATAATLWLRALWQARSSLRLGGLVAVGSLAVHDLLDFALEMSGIAVVAAVLFGAVIAPGRSRSIRESSSPFPPRRAPSHVGDLVSGRSFPTAGTVCASSAACLVLASLLLGPYLLRTDLAVVPDRLQGLIEGDAPRRAVQELLHTSLKAHPMEPELVLMGGLAAFEHHDPLVLRWLNRAMQLAPAWAAPHQVLARWLTEAGRSGQAMLEIREVEKRQPYTGRELMCELLRRVPRAEAVTRIATVRDTVLRARLLELGNLCLARLAPAEAMRVDEFWMEADPTAVAPRLRTAQRLFLDGNKERAHELWRAVLDANPGHVHARVGLGEALLSQGNPGAALELAPREERHWSLLKLRARALAALGRAGAARETVESMRREAAGKGAKLAQVLDFQATVELALGNPQLALDAQVEAAQLHPTVGRLLRLARLAESQGALFRASIAYGQLCELEPRHPTYCERARATQRSR